MIQQILCKFNKTVSEVMACSIGRVKKLNNLSNSSTWLNWIGVCDDQGMLLVRIVRVVNLYCIHIWLKRKNVPCTICWTLTCWYYAWYFMQNRGDGHFSSLTTEKSIIFSWRKIFHLNPILLSNNFKNNSPPNLIPHFEPVLQYQLLRYLMLVVIVITSFVPHCVWD